MTAAGPSGRWLYRLLMGFGVVLDLLVAGHWLMLGFMTVFGHNSPGPFAGPVGWVAAAIAAYALAMIPAALFTAAASRSPQRKSAALLLAYSPPLVGAIALQIYAS